MIDQTSTPSRLLKGSALAAKWALGLLASAWLIFILGWGVLHLLIVPRIGEWRPELENRASRVLGVQVRIGAVSAQSTGFIPSVELKDVRFFDAQNREALHLPKILAALSPRSLLGLGFEQLYIDQPHLAIRRAANGQIFVAGLDFSNTSGGDNSAADWFFAQPEIVINAGTIEWTDEQRGAPTLKLDRVNFVARNKFQDHRFRLDATPAPEWGEPLRVMAAFKQPLLSLHKGRWREWRGEVYAAFDRVDVSRLRQYADIGVDLRQGAGAVRTWVDVDRAQVTHATMDVALNAAKATLGGQLQPIDLVSLSGRLAVEFLTDGFEFSTRALQFDTRDGLHWPGGNVQVTYRSGKTPLTDSGQLVADKVDLAVLAQIAKRIPLGTAVHSAITKYDPNGLVEDIKATWQREAGAFSQYQVKGRVLGLAIESSHVPLGSPGMQGADVVFDMNQAGGQARLAMKDGTLDFPGVFEEPVVPMSALTADLLWTVQGEQIEVQSSNLKFANADTQGEAQIKWRTQDQSRAVATSRFPGVLDLKGSLSRAQANRVHRYLPLVLGSKVRAYVRDAVVKGYSNDVKFKVKGDLHDLPFKEAKQGEFQVVAKINDATFAYLPRTLQSEGTLPWPVLTQLSGELLVDRKMLQLSHVRGRLGEGTALLLTQGEGLISDLFQAVTVQVDAQAAGPLTEAVSLVNASPLRGMTAQALMQASATGQAEYRVKLGIPLAAVQQSSVQGSVTLNGNDIQMTPDTPKLSQAQGAVNFTEHGFSIVGGQSRMLDGDMRLEGGTTANGIVLHAQGSATALGLREAKELGVVAQGAQFATGSTNYTAELAFRAQALPEVRVASNLQGLALALPAPLGKAAEAALPFRFNLRNVAHPAMKHQMIELDAGQIGSFSYLRDMSQALPRVMSGTIAVGLPAQVSAPMPETGVSATIQLPQIDADAWIAALSKSKADQSSAPGLGYLPDRFSIQAKELKLSDRRLHDIVLGGTRDGLNWRTSIVAQELNGNLEYQPSTDANPGRVYARLERLTLSQASVQDVESLLDEQPASIPALDIVVDNLELRGLQLGRVEIEAVNQLAASVAPENASREWQLNKLKITMPEAVFSAKGQWEVASATPQLAPQPTQAKRRTVMNFELDITDAGALLERFGKKGLVRNGKGRMAGHIAWMGSPMQLSYPTLTGAFGVNVEQGRFLKADAGAAKLLGVLSLQSLPRRLMLDFRDLFTEGFEFDQFRGDVLIDQGIAKTNNLQMKGLNAVVLMDGQADIARETQDIKVVVIPEINAGTASLLASIANPVVGLGSFLAQMFLRKPLMDSATQEFHIDGAWADPHVVKVERKPQPPIKQPSGDTP